MAEAARTIGLLRFGDCHGEGFYSVFLSCSFSLFERVISLVVGVVGRRW